MCRMLGFSAAFPMRIRPFIEAVAHQAQHGCRPWGRSHGDGWGMILATENGWLQLRCDRPIWEFPYEQLGEIEAKAGLVHARLASPNTPVDITKVHPFCAVIEGRPLAFCHNGSITKPDQVPPAGRACLPPNPIDSELYFTLVQEHLIAGMPADEAMLVSAQEIYNAGSEPTSLNALLLAGDELVALKGAVISEYAFYYTLFVYWRDRHVIVTTEKRDEWGDAVSLEGTIVLRDGQVITRRLWV